MNEYKLEIKTEDRKDGTYLISLIRGDVVASTVIDSLGNIEHEEQIVKFLVDMIYTSAKEVTK